MISNKDILYIKQGNREIIINTIKEEFHLEITLNKLFDDWCLEELTTYKGRMEAIRKKYHLKKLIPIYINKQLMLVPISSKKDIDNIYINIINVLDIVENKENVTTIIFKNKKQLVVDKTFKFIQKYYQRSLDIYNLIR